MVLLRKSIPQNHNLQTAVEHGVRKKRNQKLFTETIKIITLYISLIERAIEFLEGKKRKQKALNTPLGETLKKVEKAQEHLTEAIESIDVIREQVVAERQELDSLLAEVQRKREQYKETTNDLEATQDLLKQDQEKLRVALGINSPREKIIGFVSGVVASTVATALWVNGPKLWALFTSLWKAYA